MIYFEFDHHNRRTQAVVMDKPGESYVRGEGIQSQVLPDCSSVPVSSGLRSRHFSSSPWRAATSSESRERAEILRCPGSRSWELYSIPCLQHTVPENPPVS